MKTKASFILTGICALTFLFAVVPCSAQVGDSAIAARFITLNNQGNYEEASRLMSPSFLQMVSPDNLEKMWYYHVMPQGKFHRVISIREMQQGKIYAVFPTCQYDKADITFAFAFDDNHQIAGFHVDTVAPKPNTGSAPKAIYQPSGNSSEDSQGH